MNSPRIFILVLTLLALCLAKPIYDHKTSYVAQLTTLNFKDQVTKIRQNTNYVSVVQFYKANGMIILTQMVIPSPLLML
jgi:hypothetical protein